MALLTIITRNSYFHTLLHELGVDSYVFHKIGSSYHCVHRSISTAPKSDKSAISGSTSRIHCKAGHALAAESICKSNGKQDIGGLGSTIRLPRIVVFAFLYTISAESKTE